MIEITGKEGITAKIIADSLANGVRLITYELTYPRFIHSELMTHRVFSRNASSSRAIPVEKFLAQVDENPAWPIFWGSNKPGMQAGDELDGFKLSRAQSIWEQASKEAMMNVNSLANIGLHKQIANRLLEPWQFMTTIVTATEWENFFSLRCHSLAQPEIHELANLMREAYGANEPEELHVTGWHTPYIMEGESWNDIGEIIKCSVARCARVSFKNHDKSDPDTLKDMALHDMLKDARHMSPFEHIATPIPMVEVAQMGWQNINGITHVDKMGMLWSGNFNSWIQYRQVL